MYSFLTWSAQYPLQYVVFVIHTRRISTAYLWMSLSAILKWAAAGVIRFPWLNIVLSKNGQRTKNFCWTKFLSEACIPSTSFNCSVSEEMLPPLSFCSASSLLCNSALSKLSRSTVSVRFLFFSSNSLFRFPNSNASAFNFINACCDSSFGRCFDDNLPPPKGIVAGMLFVACWLAVPPIYDSCLSGPFDCGGACTPVMYRIQICIVDNVHQRSFALCDSVRICFTMIIIVAAIVVLPNPAVRILSQCHLDVIFLLQKFRSDPPGGIFWSEEHQPGAAILHDPRFCLRLADSASNIGDYINTCTAYSLAATHQSICRRRLVVLAVESPLWIVDAPAPSITTQIVHA